MKRIGLISDTHGYLYEEVLTHFEMCDEIWHAGDIGSFEVSDRLAAVKPFKAVYGNIDDHLMRRTFPENVVFNCEGVTVLMTHIGGYPNKYTKRAKDLIVMHQPNLFICGHSHILKVMFDKTFNLLHINPGACGKVGFHKVNTLIRFSIEDAKIKDLEVVELHLKENK